MRTEFKEWPDKSGGDDHGRGMTEATRFLAQESIAGSSYDATKGELTIKVIQPGFNKGKGRYYPADVLKRDHGIFEGAKMFADHATDAEARQRPEGSVNNWVASVGKPWVESDGTIMAKATVIDPPFKAKLEELASKNLLREMGVSIRAIGEAGKAKVDGVDTNLVESLLRCRSVDFVTFAGAGGRVEAIESESDELDVDLMTEAQLRERRPDLVSLIESIQEEELSKTLEQQLQESNLALETVTAAKQALQNKLDEAEKAGKTALQTAAKAELAKLISEAKLPDIAKTRLEAQFKEAADSTGMKEAVDAEKAYITSLSAGVKNMGSKENGNEDVSEADKTKRTANLVESFKLLGFSDKEAAIAAKV